MDHHMIGGSLFTGNGDSADRRCQPYRQPPFHGCCLPDSFYRSFKDRTKRPAASIEKE
jgi:hypothetical protein